MNPQPPKKKKERKTVRKFKNSISRLNSRNSSVNSMNINQ